LRTPTSVRLAEAWADWHQRAKTGSVRTRSSDAYKPSALRGYEQAMRLRIVPRLGSAKLSDVSLADLQRLAGDLLAAGHDPSTIRNTLLPVRAVFRDADMLVEGGIGTNPTVGLKLPAARGRRERIASEEAARLLEALQPGIARCGQLRCTAGCALASCRRWTGCMSIWQLA
jgi:hypothetical protein